MSKGASTVDNIEWKLNIVQWLVNLIPTDHAMNGYNISPIFVGLRRTWWQSKILKRCYYGC